MHFGITGLISIYIVLSGCELASPDQPEPPTGGRTYVLNYEIFASSIDTLLTVNGCDNEACHGGGIRGTFQLSPVADKDVAMDFDQVVLQVDPADPAASPILLKPLAETAGGAAHAAPTAAFDSTADADYQAILWWIEAGEYR
jgi:hypothetical protein